MYSTKSIYSTTIIVQLDTLLYYILLTVQVCISSSLLSCQTLEQAQGRFIGKNLIFVIRRVEGLRTSREQSIEIILQVIIKLRIKNDYNLFISTGSMYPWYLCWRDWEGNDWSIGSVLLTSILTDIFWVCIYIYCICISSLKVVLLYWSKVWQWYLKILALSNNLRGVISLSLSFSPQQVVQINTH